VIQEVVEEHTMSIHHLVEAEKEYCEAWNGYEVAKAKAHRLLVLLYEQGDIEAVRRLQHALTCSFQFVSLHSSLMHPHTHSRRRSRGTQARARRALTCYPGFSPMYT